ncbi:MAG: hypothetical protein GTN36_05490 [Candidatus Aenigmarchaeota archaeon]|nr:hypothetical protein [Candidatus Aenigmarchaeota archaeon]
MFFTDTASKNLLGKISINSIIIKCTHATNPAIIELGNYDGDATTPAYNDLIKYTLPNADKSILLNFVRPLQFPKGVRIKTLTDAEITLIYEQNREE